MSCGRCGKICAKCDFSDLLYELQKGGHELAAANVQLSAYSDEVRKLLQEKIDSAQRAEQAEARGATANGFAELARLGIILRDQLRGNRGIYIGGPDWCITGVTQAIHDFDAEYARQFPKSKEAQP